ncbi:hypothetical protein AURDEDRAFT_74308 [Auricularia subglabra TFB-10046 SS5]|uniref:Uncharacterized protein n=1 Tax=Auricularia subglabra (strain TFB-10046 / SS5) TaxID=717982 RepID=J0D986_AURST|nr:hypothetical protein AURDEDRAFT_74308 [Auricularia subglabra TFB-10046 SS5]
MRLSATTTVLALAATLALAQDEVIQYNAEHNATSLIGTWSSGAGLVQTGPNFCNPKEKTFNPPKVGGISYSFSADGFFEQAEYRYGANPARPACPNVTMLFQHGSYELFPNGSIILNPIAADGLVQTQTPCGGKTSTLQQFSAQILFKNWRIFYDPPSGGYHLHLFRSVPPSVRGCAGGRYTRARPTDAVRTVGGRLGATDDVPLSSCPAAR